MVARLLFCGKARLQQAQQELKQLEEEARAKRSAEADDMYEDDEAQ
jgi:hypothetical protein